MISLKQQVLKAVKGNLVMLFQAIDMWIKDASWNQQD